MKQTLYQPSHHGWTRYLIILSRCTCYCHSWRLCCLNVPWPLFNSRLVLEYRASPEFFSSSDHHLSYSPKFAIKIYLLLQFLETLSPEWCGCCSRTRRGRWWPRNCRPQSVFVLSIFDQFLTTPQHQLHSRPPLVKTSPVLVLTVNRQNGEILAVQFKKVFAIFLKIKHFLIICWLR